MTFYRENHRCLARGAEVAGGRSGASDFFLKPHLLPRHLDAFSQAPVILSVDSSVDEYRIVYRVADKIAYVLTIVAPGMLYEQSL